MATKKMRVWVDNSGAWAWIHLHKPHWEADGSYWDSDDCEEMPCVADKLFKPLPRGTVCHEYEITAKLIRKIRPPKK